MTEQNKSYDGGTPLPKVDRNALLDSLRNGHTTPATLVEQIVSIVADVGTVVAQFTDEREETLNTIRAENIRLNKTVADMGEKCQGLQQAILYKEEKYDEKCREAARYKVICEMSARASIQDNQYYNNDRDINHNIDLNDIYGPPDKPIKGEPFSGENSGLQTQDVKMHMKLNNSQVHLSQYVNPLRSSNSRTEPPGADSNHYDECGQRIDISDYYAGGPSKRKIPINNSFRKTLESRFQERMESIGGINVRGSLANRGPVKLDRLVGGLASSLRVEDPNKRVKIDLTSQRDEMMSSSGNLTHQMRQRVVERDLHRQVAGGSWTRLASRRKKDWPF